MDAKITKKRLSRMLSYDWIKILLTIAAAIFVWLLIFTMTATRITPAQQFTACNYLGNVSFMETKFFDLYNKAYRDGIYSYEVIETNYNDFASNAEYANTLMAARFGTSEGDFMFAPITPNPSSGKIKDEVTGEVSYKYTYAESALIGYWTYYYNLDPESENGYFHQMEEYLNVYYNGDWTKKENVNKEKIEQDFRKRTKWDKRFKTDKQKKQGVKDDIARIESYRDALEEFYGYVNEGIVEFTKVSLKDIGSQKYSIEGVYYLNLCPSSDPQNRMKHLSEYVAYTHDVTEVNPETGEETVTKNVLTATDMQVCFLKMEDMTEGFQYENVLFINYLIENCLALNKTA